MAEANFIVKRSDSDQRSWKLDTTWSLAKVREQCGDSLKDSDSFTFKGAPIERSQEVAFIVAEVVAEDGTDKGKIVLKAAEPGPAELTVVCGDQSVKVTIDPGGSLRTLRAAEALKDLVSQNIQFLAKDGKAALSADDEIRTLIRDVVINGNQVIAKAVTVAVEAAAAITIVTAMSSSVVKFATGKPLAELRTLLVQMGRMKESDRFYKGAAAVDPKSEATLLVSDIVTDKKEVLLTDTRFGDTKKREEIVKQVPDTKVPDYTLKPAPVDPNVTGKAAELPAASTTADAARYESLNDGEKWKLIALKNLTRGVRLGRSGLAISFEPIANWQVLPSVIGARETLDFSTTMTHSNAVHELRKAGVKKANASGGVKGISVAGNFEEARESLSRTEKTEVYLLAVRDVPKVRLSIPRDRLLVSPKFIDSITEAVAPQRTMTAYLNLLDQLNQWGQYVPRTFVLGGQIYAEDKKTVTGQSELESVSRTFGAAVEADVVIKGVPVQAGGGYGQTDRSQTTDTRQDAAQHVSIRVRGGDPAAFSDHAKWIGTLGPVNSWSVIKYDDLVPSIDLLEDELFGKCIYLIQKHSLSPDTAHRTEVDMAAYVNGLSRSVAEEFL